MEVGTGGQLVISSLVDDLTIQQPGFDLPRCYWALLNRIRTNQGHGASCRKKWGLVLLWQMLSNVTYYQQLPTVEAGGGLQQLHSADDVAVEWLKTYGS